MNDEYDSGLCGKLLNDYCNAGDTTDTSAEGALSFLSVKASPLTTAAAGASVEGVVGTGDVVIFVASLDSASPSVGAPLVVGPSVAASPVVAPSTAAPLAAAPSVVTPLVVASALVAVDG